MISVPNYFVKAKYIEANVSKDRLTTKAINKISRVRAKALRQELVED